MYDLPAPGTKPFPVDGKFCGGLEETTESLENTGFVFEIESWS
jgi:hypothetical protein